MSLQGQDANVERLRGIFEPLLALVAALFLTALLTLPFVPTRQRVEVELRSAPGSSRAIPHPELQEQVELLGLADSAEELLLDGASRLVLRGVSDIEQTEQSVGELLERAGYQPGDFVATDEIHMEGFLRTEAYSLPLLLSISSLIFGIGGYWLARGRVHRIPPEAAAPPLVATLYGLGAGVTAIVLSVVISGLLSLVGLPVEEQDWLTDLYTDPQSVLRIAPWLLIVGPVSEEIFFRGYFFRFTTQRAGLPTGFLLSSAMFAVVHGNASGFLVYLGIGCVFAWAAHRTGRLVTAIVGHMTLNAIVLVVSALSTDLNF